jgi:hypothetical protein
MEIAAELVCRTFSPDFLTLKLTNAILLTLLEFQNFY